MVVRSGLRCMRHFLKITPVFMQERTRGWGKASNDYIMQMLINAHWEGRWGPKGAEKNFMFTKS